MARQLSYNGDPSKSAAQVSRAQWQRYKDVYTPVENELIGSLGSSVSPQAAEQAAEQAARADEVTDRMRSRYGLAEITPAIADRRAAISSASDQASAYNGAELARIDRRDTIRNSLVNNGQGILNQATGGLSSASSMQTNREAANASAQAQADAQASQQKTALASTAILAAAMFA